MGDLSNGSRLKLSAISVVTLSFRLSSCPGFASGYLSVLVLALYINSPEVQGMYSNPVLMWPACLVMLYWVSRIWIIAHRGNMDDDPIVFALKDRASVIAGALIVGFMLLAV